MCPPDTYGSTTVACQACITAQYAHTSMLTGRKAYEGKSRMSLLARIINEDATLLGE